MQEFESISASSYDPSALATKLTAKAAEGWSVVAIVPTGGDVTAFVSREKGGSDDSTKPEASKAEATPPASDISDKGDSGDAGDKGDKGDDDGPALELPAKTEPATAAKTEVSEPSGWAIAPEPAATTPEPTGVQPTVGITPTSTYQPGGSTSSDPSPASTPGASTPASVNPAASTPAATVAPTPDPAPAPAVPAGWYADPAGRFELRYWDGSTWTEHVSRAGQQFTDPPVA